MKYQAIGFHGTDSNAAADIRDNGFDSTRAARNAFLGPGFYFWDNSEERAWYWVNSSPDQDDGKTVIKAAIDLSEYLDLTTQEGRSYYRDFILRFLERPFGKHLYENKEVEDDPFFLDTLLERSGGEVKGVRAAIMRRKEGYNQRADLLHEERVMREKLDRSRIVTNMDIVISARTNATIVISEDDDEEI